MAKVKTAFFCSECGQQSPKWQGQCPACGSWNTFQEGVQRSNKAGNRVASLPSRPTAYRDIALQTFTRLPTGMRELDRVLGSGLVPGSLLLFGGDPGIGKSTLMLQVAAYFCNQNQRVLYVSGEESLAQIKLRGQRLQINAPQLELLAETSFEALEQILDAQQHQIVFVDSIQTLYTAALPSAPGSVGQVREIAARLLNIAKSKNISVVLIGHVTKEGNLAGPKTLEHMVDGVFYFEGDKYNSLRLLRAQKNRFGPAHELGLFQMDSNGLVEVPNPSQVLLAQRPEQAAGSAVLPCMEGTRPLMVEVQVLLSTSTYAAPRRLAMGIDSNRLALIMAILEKKAGLQLQGLDTFVNVVGGISIQEPAADLGLALAVYSAFRNVPLSKDVAVFGELGLSGELRSVSQGNVRAKECRSLGFKKLICPKSNVSEIHEDIQIAGVTTLVEALEQAL